MQNSNSISHKTLGYRHIYLVKVYGHRKIGEGKLSVSATYVVQIWVSAYNKFHACQKIVNSLEKRTTITVGWTCPGLISEGNFYQKDEELHQKKTSKLVGLIRSLEETDTQQIQQKDNDEGYLYYDEEYQRLNRDHFVNLGLEPSYYVRDADNQPRMIDETRVFISIDRDRRNTNER